MGTKPMTVRTDNVAFSDLGAEFGLRSVSVQVLRHTEGFHFTGTMVKVHHEVRVAHTAVGTGSVLHRTQNSAPPVGGRLGVAGNPG